MEPFLKNTLTSKHHFCLALYIYCWTSSNYVFFFPIRYNQVNAISVACSHGLSSCITMASGLFRDYRNGTNK